VHTQKSEKCSNKNRGIAVGSFGVLNIHLFEKKREFFASEDFYHLLKGFLPGIHFNKSDTFNDFICKFNFLVSYKKSLFKLFISPALESLLNRVI
jgi:hypothetical protein